MKYTDQEIKRTILDFIEETEQTELRYVIPFCLGYYGYISNQIWRQILALTDAGVIEG